MARHIKNKSCCEQMERGNARSGANFLGTLRNIFRLSHTKPAVNALSYGTARKTEKFELMAIEAQVEKGQAQLRRLQMIQ